VTLGVNVAILGLLRAAVKAGAAWAEWDSDESRQGRVVLRRAGHQRCRSHPTGEFAPRTASRVLHRPGPSAILLLFRGVAQPG